MWASSSVEQIMARTAVACMFTSTRCRSSQAAAALAGDLDAAQQQAAARRADTTVEELSRGR
jgi:hypothetical protein